MSNPALTVYFRGFPEQMADIELETAFTEYGKIVKFFIHKNRSYGMVEFDNLSSCHNLIRSLNGVPPLNLYLNMAKATKNTNTNMAGNSSPGVQFNNNFEYVEQDMYVDENNSLINVLHDPDTNEIYVPIRYAQRIRRLQRKVPVVANKSQNQSENL